MKTALTESIRLTLKLFFDEFEWIHITIGIIGNTTLFIGSTLFYYEHPETIATWFFMGGSFLMLIGSIGSGLVRYTYNRERKH